MKIAFAEPADSFPDSADPHIGTEIPGGTILRRKTAAPDNSVSLGDISCRIPAQPLGGMEQFRNLFLNRNIKMERLNFCLPGGDDFHGGKDHPVIIDFMPEPEFHPLSGRFICQTDSVSRNFLIADFSRRKRFFIQIEVDFSVENILTLAEHTGKTSFPAEFISGQQSFYCILLLISDQRFERRNNDPVISNLISSPGIFFPFKRAAVFPDDFSIFPTFAPVIVAVPWFTWIMI